MIRAWGIIALQIVSFTQKPSRNTPLEEGSRPQDKVQRAVEEGSLDRRRTVREGTGSELQGADTELQGEDVRNRQGDLRTLGAAHRELSVFDIVISTDSVHSKAALTGSAFVLPISESSVTDGADATSLSFNCTTIRTMVCRLLPYRCIWATCTLF